MDLIAGKFREKPVVIEAVRFTGRNSHEVMLFMGRDSSFVDQSEPRAALIISTLEGPLRASVGDWIIKGVKGEFYPCKPDIFEATYEPVG